MNDLHVEAAAPSDIGRLRLDVTPVAPTATVNQAADLFLQPEYSGLLSLPVVDGGRVIGSISRHQLNNIFLRRFGREVYGGRSVLKLMNPEPLRVDAGSTLEEAAQYVTAHIGSPITEDFIVVRDGLYAGAGLVLDLLHALEQRVASNAAKLADAYGQLKESQAQLVQSEKMASLGQMVAGVAHEINTPLGYVRNNVEVIQDALLRSLAALREHDEVLGQLMDGAPDEAALAERMSAARRVTEELREARVLDDAPMLMEDTLYGVDQIKELVINLKNFSRLDQARTAEVSLNDCLDQTLVIANSVLKGRVEIVKSYGEIPPVNCAPSQINQVLLNMLTNAAQSIEHDHGQLLLETRSEGGFVQVGLQDNGKGIAPEHLQKIFDPFFTTKPVGQGTGLGLSISFQIVQAHGGSIRVSSEVGKGTRFVVSLPVRAAVAQAA